MQEMIKQSNKKTQSDENINKQLDKIIRNDENS